MFPESPANNDASCRFPPRRGEKELSSDRDPRLGSAHSWIAVSTMDRTITKPSNQVKNRRKFLQNCRRLDP
jgi:hypothetical protein